MTDIKIKVGGYDVIASGQFIGLTEERNEIELVQDTQKIKIALLFENDDVGQPKLTSKVISNTELEVVFNNFDNSLGMGNTTPLKIGTFNGKELFFNYRIFVLNDKKLRTIDYTFYAK